MRERGCAQLAFMRKLLIKYVINPDSRKCFALQSSLSIPAG